MAACAACAATLPRAATACPHCGAPVARAARRVAAKAAAEPVAKAAAKPVVKAVAKPVAPAVKAGAAPAKATPKVTPPPAPATDGDGPAAPPRKRAARSRTAATAAPAAPAARPAADAWTSAYDAVPAATDVTPGDVSPPAPERSVGGTPPVPAAAAPPRRAHARRSYGDVIGEADERDPADPVVVAAERPALPDVFEVVFDDLHDKSRWPLPLRVVRGDWFPALRAAVPALGVLLLVAAVAAGSLLIATRPGGDESLVGDTSAGRWVRYVCATVAMAFGGQLSFTAGSEGSGGLDDLGVDFGYAVRLVPLTVTLLGLAALWVFARRSYERNVTPDRLPDAIRTAAVYGVGVAALAVFARWRVTSGAEEAEEFGGEFAEEFLSTWSFAVSPWRPLFWAFCAALAITWLASGTVAVTGRWTTWLFAARGALVGVAAGIAASFLLLVVLGYAYADEVGAEASDVTNALPLGLAYAVDLGAAGFGVLSGGQFVLPAEGRGRWSLLAPWLPKPFLLLLVVPALAVLLAAYYLTRRAGLPRAEAVRACERMWLPAAALWLAVAAIGSARVTQSVAFGFLGATSAGPVLWAALLVALWFGAGGWLAGRLLAARVPAEAAPDGAPRGADDPAEPPAL